MAHGLSAYIAALFAIKYPYNLFKLILLSPIGIPPKLN